MSDEINSELPPASPIDGSLRFYGAAAHMLLGGILGLVTGAGIEHRADMANEKSKKPQATTQVVSASPEPVETARAKEQKIITDDVNSLRENFNIIQAEATLTPKNDGEKREIRRVTDVALKAEIDAALNLGDHHAVTTLGQDQSAIATLDLTKGVVTITREQRNLLTREITLLNKRNDQAPIGHSASR